jgi:hypothetical protein
MNAEREYADYIAHEGDAECKAVRCEGCDHHFAVHLLKNGKCHACQRHRRTFHIARFGPTVRTYSNYVVMAGELKHRYIFDKRERHQLIEHGPHWERAISPHYIDTGEVLVTQAVDKNLCKTLEDHLERKEPSAGGDCEETT